MTEIYFTGMCLVMSIEKGNVYRESNRSKKYRETSPEKRCGMKFSIKIIKSCNRTVRTLHVKRELKIYANLRTCCLYRNYFRNRVRKTKNSQFTLKIQGFNRDIIWCINFHLMFFSRRVFLQGKNPTITTASFFSSDNRMYT